MEIKAKARFIHMSPKKMRLVLDVIRRMDVEEAENQLKFIPKQACRPILKLLNSAVANAKENYGLEKENLYIKEIRADEGPTLKRWMPKAHGRATPIRKRSSHISVILGVGKKLDSRLAGRKIAEIRKKEDKIKKIKKLTKLTGKEIVEEIKSKEPLKSGAEYKPKPKDVRREASHRWKGHLDKLGIKEAGGMVKRIFRRKAG